MGKPSHPLREDVSWNTTSYDSGMGDMVILFVRMWVEIPFPTQKRNGHPGHPLREDVSWNVVLNPCCVWYPVILFVRMWVEIIISMTCPISQVCHPLREDVSWNIYYFAYTLLLCSHPLREDVSWNIDCCRNYNFSCCHPLREDVSWNGSETSNSFYARWLSSSSWGCELKYLPDEDLQQVRYVILFVRMWVEITIKATVFYRIPVILFVRMWVEIWRLQQFSHQL